MSKERDEPVWNAEKNGKPTCSICFGVPNRPIYLPCKCASLLCFACFEGLLKEFSKCHICRERLLPKLRKKCKGKDLEEMIDLKLWDWIKTTFPQESEENAISSSSSFSDFVDHSDESWKKRHIPPEPGELKREADCIVAKHAKEREIEEKASELLLEEFKKNGDADIVETERWMLDEQYARRLQEELNAGAKSSASIIVLDEEGLEVDSKNKLATKSDSKKARTHACWTCKVCTFSETNIKWLRCDVCGSNKN